MDDDLRLWIVEQVAERTGLRILASSSPVMHTSKRKARDRNILCQGRGSAANSAVSSSSSAQPRLGPAPIAKSLRREFPSILLLWHKCQYSEPSIREAKDLPTS
jgi:hypothetical protein